jgi:hypothetical protein
MNLLAKNEESVMGMRGHCEMMDAKAKEQDATTYASINWAVGRLSSRSRCRTAGLRQVGKLRQGRRQRLLRRQKRFSKS